MDGTCSMHGERCNMHFKVHSENFEGRDHLGDLGIDESWRNNM
jgi:hypothetical protein